MIYALKIACCIGVSVVVITAAIALLPAAAAGAGAVATVEASTTAASVVATVEASTIAAGVVGAEVCGCVATGAEVAAGIGYTKILIGSAVTIGGISSAGTISHYK